MCAPLNDVQSTYDRPPICVWSIFNFLHVAWLPRTHTEEQRLSVLNCLIFEVLVVVRTSTAVFWVVTLRTLVVCLLTNVSEKLRLRLNLAVTKRPICIPPCIVQLLSLVTSLLWSLIDLFSRAYENFALQEQFTSVMFNSTNYLSFYDKVYIHNYLQNHYFKMKVALFSVFRTNTTQCAVPHLIFIISLAAPSSSSVSTIYIAFPSLLSSNLFLCVMHHLGPVMGLFQSESRSQCKITAIGTNQVLELRFFICNMKPFLSRYSQVNQVYKITAVQN